MIDNHVLLNDNLIIMYYWWQFSDLQSQILSIQYVNVIRQLYYICIHFFEIIFYEEYQYVMHWIIISTPLMCLHLTVHILFALFIIYLILYVKCSFVTVFDYVSAVVL